uniref:Uncharacterized protein n=1 Tax=Rhipicephalus appendiculatus TaxID=34631 RepID=A0A131YBA2_RHIAP
MCCTSILRLWCLGKVRIVAKFYLTNARYRAHVWCWSWGDWVLVKWRQCYLRSLYVFTCASILTNVSEGKGCVAIHPTAFVVECVYGLQLCTK